MPVRMRWRIVEVTDQTAILVKRSPPDAAAAAAGAPASNWGRSGAPRGVLDPGEIGADTAPLARQAIAIHWLEYPIMSGFTLMSEWSSVTV
jgi:hypothetical protein